MSHLLSVLFLIAVLAAVNANILGTDLNAPGAVNSTVFECLKKEQNMDLVVQASSASCPVCCDNLRTAKNAGFQHGQVLIYPYPTASVGSALVKGVADYINTNCKDAFDGQIWIDVMQPQNWPTPWGEKGYVENKKQLAFRTCRLLC